MKLLITALIAATVIFTGAAPGQALIDSEVAGGGRTGSLGPVPQDALSQDGWLDIQMIGDSNLHGQNTDGNSGCNGVPSDGPRQYLADLLTSRVPAMYSGFNERGCRGNRWSEGWGGRTWNDAQRLYSGFLNNPPPARRSVDLVVFMLGTNDLLNDGDSPEQAVADAVRAVDGVLQDYPQAKVLVLTATHFSASRNQRKFRELSLYNDLLVQGVYRRDQSRVGVADLEHIDERYMFDGLHLNDTGNKLAAEAIFNSAPMFRWYGLGGNRPSPSPGC